MKPERKSHQLPDPTGVPGPFEKSIGDLCDAGAMVVAIVLTAMAGPSQGLLQATGWMPKGAMVNGW